jgi:RecA-family ATPase
MEGDPNVGKSYLAMYIAAQVTVGGSMPGGKRLKPGRVLYLSTEDEPEYTIRPRIEAMGGDVSRVRILTGKNFPLDEDGIALLRDELKERPARLIVLIHFSVSYLRLPIPTNLTT